MTKRVLAVLCLVLLVAGCASIKPGELAWTVDKGTAIIEYANPLPFVFQAENYGFRVVYEITEEPIRVLSYTTTVLTARYVNYQDALQTDASNTACFTTNYPACKIHKITYGTTDKPLFVIKSQELLEGLPKPWETWDYYSGGETWIESVQE